jgi:hypothetical protein
MVLAVAVAAVVLVVMEQQPQAAQEVRLLFHPLQGHL